MAYERKILVIDDEPTIADFTERFLHIDGYPTATAKDGQMAIEKMKDGSSYGLIVTDFSYPGRKDFGDYIRENHLGTPVIAMTAVPTPEVEAIARKELRAVRLLAKPLDIKEFLGIVKELYVP
ncbi:MAG: response regulator [Candidatus Aenigmatarchaeota archaeon]